MTARRKPVAARAPVFGSMPAPAAPLFVTPAARPREWEPFPGGRVGWSWESRDWLAEPNDGRPSQGNFTARQDAVAYLEGK